MSTSPHFLGFPPISGRLIIATHNDGKLKEFRDLLGFYQDEIVSAGFLGLPSPEETGITFVENALLKARAVSEASGSIALSDDSGLCVTALNNQPGLFSARWAEPGKNFTSAMQRIQDELGNNPDRSAFFICVLALVWPDGHAETIEGRINGTIAPSPRGSNGHGYDPIFVPEGETRSFAEMTDTEKNAISHRARATKLLIDKFFSKTR